MLSISSAWSILINTMTLSINQLMHSHKWWPWNSFRITEKGFKFLKFNNLENSVHDKQNLIWPHLLDTLILGWQIFQSLRELGLCVVSVETTWATSCSLTLKCTPPHLLLNVHGFYKVNCLLNFLITLTHLLYYYFLWHPLIWYIHHNT